MSGIAIKWHGELVGRLTDAQPDMWYLEGQWHPVPSAHTDRFLARAASLDPKAFVTGSQRGLVVTLHDETDAPEAQPAFALVGALPAKTIFVRRVIDAKAVELVRGWEREEA